MAHICTWSQPENTLDRTLDTQYIYISHDQTAELFLNSEARWSLALWVSPANGAHFRPLWIEKQLKLIMKFMGNGGKPIGFRDLWGYLTFVPHRALQTIPQISTGMARMRSRRRSERIFGSNCWGWGVEWTPKSWCFHAETHGEIRIWRNLPLKISESLVSEGRILIVFMGFIGNPGQSTGVVQQHRHQMNPISCQDNPSALKSTSSGASRFGFALPFTSCPLEGPKSLLKGHIGHIGSVGSYPNCYIMLRPVRQTFLGIFNILLWSCVIAEAVLVSGRWEALK